jgi:DDE family transposase
MGRSRVRRHRHDRRNRSCNGISGGEGYLKAGGLAHLPSAWFTANGAWLVLAAIAFNLTRAAGALASTFHARATTATIRAQLITIPARPTRSARRVTLRLPSNWPWQHAWLQFFTAATGPPALAAA